MKRKIIILILCMVMLMPNNVIAQGNSESPSQWAKKDIDALQVMTLLKESIYSNYQENITRVEYAYLIYKLYETITNKPITYSCDLLDESTFTDTNDYYVLALKTAGIINGYPDGTYKPNSNITREEIASLYVRTIEKAGIPLSYDNSHTFSDESAITSWSRENIYKCYTNDILKGKSNNRMDPKGYATIEQSLVMFYRIVSQDKYLIMKNNQPSMLEPLTVQYHHNYLYYVQHDLEGNRIGIKQYKDYTLIGVIYNQPLLSDIIAYDNKLFFVNHKQQLVSYAINSKEEQILVNNCPGNTEFTIVENKLYYLDINQQLIALDITSKDEQVVATNGAKGLKAYDDKVYYISIDGNLVEYNGSTFNTYSVQLENYSIVNDTIYYIDKAFNRLLGYTIIDGNEVVYIDDVVDFEVIGNYIIFIDNEHKLALTPIEFYSKTIISENTLMDIQNIYNYMSVKDSTSGFDMYHLVPIFNMNQYFSH